MKGVFVTLATLAVAAFAAPVVETRQADQALNILDNIIIQDLGAGQVVDSSTKRDVTDAAGLIASLTSALSTVKTQSGAINSTLAGVKSGATSKADASTSTTKSLKAMHFTLTTLVTSLTSAAGIPVQDADLDKVLTLVTALVSEVLFTVNGLVTILGIRPQLFSILHSVFGIVSNLIIVVTALVTGLVLPLVAGLSPLLAALGNGLLAPLLTPVAALLAGLAGPQL